MLNNLKEERLGVISLTFIVFHLNVLLVESH